MKMQIALVGADDPEEASQSVQRLEHRRMSVELPLSRGKI